MDAAADASDDFFDAEECFDDAPEASAGNSRNKIATEHRELLFPQLSLGDNGGAPRSRSSAENNNDGAAFRAHRAAFSNDVETLRHLLTTLPADQLHQLDPHGHSALHIAAFRQHKEAVQLLCDSGMSS